MVSVGMRKLLAGIFVLACLTLPGGRAHAGGGMVTFTPSFKAYGSVVVGQSSPGGTGEQFHIINGTPSSISVSSLDLGTNANHYAIYNDGCSGQSLGASNGNCYFSVRFSPTSRGSKGTTLTANTTAGASYSSLTGSGVAPVVGVSPASRDFMNVTVGQSSLLEFAVSNSTTDSDQTLSYSFSTTASQFTVEDGSSPSCTPGGGTLAVGTSCNIGVRYTPVDGTQTTGNLTVTTNDPVTPSLNRGLVGKGLVPGLSISPTSFGWGTQIVTTSSSVQSFTLTNDGNGSVQVQSIVLGGTDPTQFTLDATNCVTPKTLSPTETCSVDVAFAPGSTGEKSASLDVTSTGPDPSAALTGTGVPLPDTEITKAKINNDKRSATFTFTSDTVGATFECQLDGLDSVPCNNGTIKYTHLTPGSHTFSVVATANGASDPDPAEKIFKIKKHR